ncbi:MAG: PIN domain-containing protein [bacterium]
MSKSKSKHTVNYYWDACVFLAGITGEANRLPVVESLLQKCENEDIYIHTSILSLVEVAFSRNEKDFRQQDPKIEEAINDLWAPASKIRIVEFYDLLAIRAKTLMREVMEKGWMIKPADAIHLVTAQSVGVDEFHTYDKSVINKHKDDLGDILGFLITEPHKEPSLFDELHGPQEQKEE